MHKIELFSRLISPLGLPAKHSGNVWLYFDGGSENLGHHISPRQFWKSVIRICSAENPGRKNISLVFCDFLAKRKGEMKGVFFAKNPRLFPRSVFSAQISLQHPEFVQSQHIVLSPRPLGISLSLPNKTLRSEVPSSPPPPLVQRAQPCSENQCWADFEWVFQANRRPTNLFSSQTLKVAKLGGQLSFPVTTVERKRKRVERRKVWNCSQLMIEFGTFPRGEKFPPLPHGISVVSVYF